MLNENDKQGVTRQSRWKTLGIAALSFFFTVLCVFFWGVAYTIYQQEMKSYIGIVVGGVALFFFIFFGFIFICALYRIISPKLSVVIKMQDIMVYPSEWKLFGNVIWSFFFTILGIFIMGIGYTIYRKDMKLDIGVLFIICVGLFFTIFFGYFSQKQSGNSCPSGTNQENPHENQCEYGLCTYRDFAERFTDVNRRTFVTDR